MKDNTANFQIIGASLAYILVMVISWFKNLQTSGANAIFSTMILFGIVHKTFVKRKNLSKIEFVFSFLMMFGSVIIIISSFCDLF